MAERVSRPPPEERTKTLLQSTRRVSRLEARYRTYTRKLEETREELRAARRAVRDLLADSELYGPDGQNVGDLP
jgi:hypothetical protein